MRYLRVFNKVSPLAAALLLLCTAGCPRGGDGKGGADGKGDSATGGGDKNQSATDKIYTYTLEQVGGVGDYLPALDGGRVEFAPPKDWEWGSRQDDLLVWFHKPKNVKLPQIRVTAADALADAPQNATVEDIVEYAQWVDGYVKDQKLSEPVVPLVLEKNAFGRYVRTGEYHNSPVDRQFLVTTANGRIYTIELIVYQGDLRRSKETTVYAAYAVGAGMKVIDADAPESSDAPEPMPK